MPGVRGRCGSPEVWLHSSRTLTDPSGLAEVSGSSAAIGASRLVSPRSMAWASSIPVNPLAIEPISNAVSSSASMNAIRGLGRFSRSSAATARRLARRPASLSNSSANSSSPEVGSRRCTNARRYPAAMATTTTQPTSDKTSPITVLLRARRQLARA